MKFSLYFLTLSFLFLISCKNTPSKTSDQWVEFPGRETRENIYRIKIPKEWEVKLANSNLGDTRTPLLTLSYGTIQLTIHNFPAIEIPPKAQVFRWQKQFALLEASVITPQAFSGYAGLLFEGQGILKGEQTMILAWALRLDDNHRKKIEVTDKKADITIKASGSQKAMQEQKKVILEIARSFEMLIPILEEDG